MKSLIIVYLLLGCVSLKAQTPDPKIATADITVSGVCALCKARIENAAIIHGVKAAEWTADSQKLHVVYRTDKVNLQAIRQSVAKAGHDTDLIKATDAAYHKLPICCFYREGQAIH